VKAGDLVTLSAYAKQTMNLNKWAFGRWITNPLIGIVVKIEDMGDRKYHSKNENIHYYINWMHSDAPASRWGNYGYSRRPNPYFYRKDLKFVSKS
tara:strand:- start:196 stop:480 length:285 start_codon:yes stop_codon:yes gene_type:complete